MSDQAEYKGNCFCGKITFTLTGKPAAMAFCHCKDCRSWSAAPVTAASLWPPDSFKITQGRELIASFNKSPQSTRHWCKACGGHLYNEHPHWNLVDVYPAVIAGLVFKPALHVNYESTVLPIKDGLPKMKDFPKEMGGSGELLPE